MAYRTTTTTPFRQVNHTAAAFLRHPTKFALSPLVGLSRNSGGTLSANRHRQKLPLTYFVPCCPCGLPRKLPTGFERTRGTGSRVVMQAFSGKLRLSETNLQNTNTNSNQFGMSSFLIARSCIHPHISWISFATFHPTQAVGVAASCGRGALSKHVASAMLGTGAIISRKCITDHSLRRMLFPESRANVSFVFKFFSQCQAQRSAMKPCKPIQEQSQPGYLSALHGSQYKPVHPRYMRSEPV
jgi:hypothetical protein